MNPFGPLSLDSGGGDISPDLSSTATSGDTTGGNLLGGNISTGSTINFGTSGGSNSPWVIGGVVGVALVGIWLLTRRR